MADDIQNSDEHGSSGKDHQDPGDPSRPFLRMRPKHFFSNDFRMEVVQDYSKSDVEDLRESPPNWLGRLMELNLLFIILLIGVPVLVYCILASAT